MSASVVPRLSEMEQHTSVGELNRVGGTPLQKGSVDVDLTDVVDQHGDRPVGATQ